LPLIKNTTKIKKSYPTDRDGNNLSMKNDSLRMLTTELLENGIVIYDTIEFINGLPISPGDKEKVFHLNTEKLLHL